MFGAPHRLFSHVFEVMHRTEFAMVAQDHKRLMRARATDAAIFAVACSAWLVSPIAPRWLAPLAGVVVAVQLVRSLVLAQRRAMAFRSGWVHGRHAMFLAMREAMQRGMSIDDWATAEVSRDAAMLGLEITPET